MKICTYALLILLIFTAPAFANVAVSSPANGQTVSSPAQFVATANTTTCSRGVAAMGVYINNVLKYVGNGSSLNTTLPLSPGTYNSVVEEWDYCGGATYTPVAITVVNQTGVVVESPANNSTVGSPVNFVAKAGTSSCSSGVASMGVYVDNSLKYVGAGSSLNTAVAVSPGTHNTVVEAWDYCGGAIYTPVAINATGQTGVFVTSPANNSTVGSPANFAATATSSSCPQGVAAMGVYVNNNLVYTTNGAKLNTPLTLGAGAQHAVVQEWDYCGGSTYTPVDVTVQGGGGKVLSNLQAAGGWNSWGEFAPLYDICTGSCWGVGWSMSQHASSPSLSGNATRFDLSGSVPYSDALWSNPVIGQNTTQNLPDNDHTLLPSIHYLTYDADVYVTNANVTQTLEFDINMYLNGAGMIWGTQCNHLADGDWDIWDNVNANWVSSGVGCSLTNGWHHVTLQMQREPNNDLLYQSITWDGATHNLDRTFAPFPVSSSWWGITVNYQMDGNYNQSANTTYLDNLTLTYQ